MEELQPEDLEDLVQELEEESEKEGALAPEVEALLADLQPARLYTSRRRAAEQLGEVSKSSRQIVLALVAAARTDSSAEVRAAAAESLLAPVHQVVLQRHSGLTERAQLAAQQRIATRQVTRPVHLRAESHGDTLRISWKPEPGRRSQVVQGPLFLLLLSAILLAASVSWPPSQIHSVWVLLLCATAFGSAYWILAALANSTSISVGKEEWVIQRGPLPFPKRHLYLCPRRLDPASCRWVWTDRVETYKRFQSSDSAPSAEDLLGCLPGVGGLITLLKGIKKELVVTYKLCARCADGSDKELLRLLSKGEAEYLRHALQNQLDAGDRQPAQG